MSTDFPGRVARFQKLHETTFPHVLIRLNAFNQYPDAPKDERICSKLSQNVNDHGAILIQHGRNPETIHRNLRKQKLKILFFEFILPL